VNGDPDAPYARVWLGAWFLLRPLGRLLLRPQVSGAQHVPRRGGAVLAFTHDSLLDALLVTQVLPRPTRFMAAQGVFRVPLVGRLLRASGQFAVRRGERDRDAVRRAIAIAQAGGLVGIFPQGGLRQGVPLDRIHRGAAMIAIRAGVPLIPIALGRGPAFVRVGAPLAPTQDARALTRELSAALQALVSRR
jgi:1-acyl-sn-glycerol-3-phosphate acyltransferase